MTIHNPPESSAIITAIATLVRAAYIDGEPTEETRELWKEVGAKARGALDSLAKRLPCVWVDQKPELVGWYGKRKKSTKAQTMVWVDYGRDAGQSLTFQTIDGVNHLLAFYDPDGEYEWYGPVELAP